MSELVEAFNQKVEPRAQHECWPWGGTINHAGYGVFHFRGKRWIASRMALIIKVGRELSKKEFACHTCDNPSCVNPEHLWVGSCSENAKDASRKRRLYVQKNPQSCFFASEAGKMAKARGSAHGAAKLNEDSVREIKRLIKDGARHRDLAGAYGVKVSTISYISRGKTWRHVHG